MTIKQYNMLGEFQRHDYTIHRVLRFAQRTFGSLCKHKWVLYSVDAKVFHISAEGRRVYSFFCDTEQLFRLNAKRPLSKYAPSRVSKVLNIRKAA